MSGSLQLFYFERFTAESAHSPAKPSPALLDWKYVQDKLPWGVILLLGIPSSSANIAA